jgi:predicted CXXCH cytochrome family protein
MKKIIALAIALTAGSAMAAVGTTKHNMAAFSGYNQNTNVLATGGAGGDVCLYCHCAHTPSTVSTAAPLWNRTNPATGSYQTYVSNTISKNITSAGVDTVSLACLSCHDGSVAVNVVVKYGGQIGAGAPKFISSAAGADPNKAIGPNLGNDHPISLTWNPAANPSAGLSATPFPAPFVSYTVAGQQMLTCGSCHEPHGTTNSYFLRANPTSGSFCATCHSTK